MRDTYLYLDRDPTSQRLDRIRAWGFRSVVWKTGSQRDLGVQKESDADVIRFRDACVRRGLVPAVLCPVSPNMTDGQVRRIVGWQRQGLDLEYEAESFNWHRQASRQRRQQTGAVLTGVAQSAQAAGGGRYRGVAVYPARIETVAVEFAGSPIVVEMYARPNKYGWNGRYSPGRMATYVAAELRGTPAPKWDATLPFYDISSRDFAKVTLLNVLGAYDNGADGLGGWSYANLNADEGALIERINVIWSGLPAPPSLISANA